MRAIADVCVIPLGPSSSASVRGPVARAHQILAEAGLHTSLHAYGTNVEGELRAVLEAIARVHEELHAEGVVRLSTSIKLGTRTDKAQSLDDKLRAVHDALDAEP